MTRKEKTNTTGWFVANPTKDMAWTGRGADLQDSFLLISPLVPPADTEHNRNIGHVRPENSKMSVRASTRHGSSETHEYVFLSLSDIQRMYLHLKGELEKHNLLP